MLTALAESCRAAAAVFDIDPTLGSGKELTLRLADRGVLVKDTHGSTIRIAPPLVITTTEIDWAMERFAETLTDMAA